MNSLTRRLIASLAFVLAAPMLRAQSPSDTAYTPSYKTPDGKQIVAIYIGALSCGPCGFAATKDAIVRMKPLLAAQSAREGASFFARVVSVDWELKSSTEFVQPLGAFDEYLLGANWIGLGSQHHLFADTSSTKAIPQVILLERTVVAGQRNIEFGPERVIRRVVGAPDIAAWVRAGAPLRDHPM